MSTKTKDARIRVANHGRGNWRTEAQDDLGEWVITGPPYATKNEALLYVDHVRDYFFGSESKTSETAELSVWEP